MSEDHPLNRQQRRALDKLKRSKNYTPAFENDEVDAGGDQGWDDLHNIYIQCRALSVTPAQVLPLMKNPEYMAKIQDSQELLRIAKLLAEQVPFYNEILNKIHQGHANKRGSTQDANELMECLEVGEHYQQWMNEYQTYVMPNVEQILQLFQTPDETPSPTPSEDVPLQGDIMPPKNSH